MIGMIVTAVRMPCWLSSSWAATKISGTINISATTMATYMRRVLDHRRLE
jgi:hypothetical protein